MEEKYLRPKHAAERCGLSIRTLARLLNSDPGFPRPIRLSSRLILFSQRELDCYLNDRRKRTLRQPPVREFEHAR